jgi:hypothetical protein
MVKAKTRMKKFIKWIRTIHGGVMSITILMALGLMVTCVTGDSIYFLTSSVISLPIYAIIK